MPGLLDNPLLLLGMGMAGNIGPGPGGRPTNPLQTLGGGLQFLLEAEQQKQANLMAQAKLEELRSDRAIRRRSAAVQEGQLTIAQDKLAAEQAEAVAEQTRQANFQQVINSPEFLAAGPEEKQRLIAPYTNPKELLEEIGALQRDQTPSGLETGLGALAAAIAAGQQVGEVPLEKGHQSEVLRDLQSKVGKYRGLVSLGAKAEAITVRYPGINDWGTQLKSVAGNFVQNFKGVFREATGVGLLEGKAVREGETPITSVTQARKHTAQFLDAKGVVVPKGARGDFVSTLTSMAIVKAGVDGLGEGKSLSDRDMEIVLEEMLPGGKAEPEQILGTLRGAIENSGLVLRGNVETVLAGDALTDTREQLLKGLPSDESVRARIQSGTTRDIAISPNTLLGHVPLPGGARSTVTQQVILDLAEKYKQTPEQVMEELRKKGFVSVR